MALVQCAVSLVRGVFNQPIGDWDVSHAHTVGRGSVRRVASFFGVAQTCSEYLIAADEVEREMTKIFMWSGDFRY